MKAKDGHTIDVRSAGDGDVEVVIVSATPAVRVLLSPSDANRLAELLQKARARTA